MLELKNKEDLYLFSTVRIEATSEAGVSTGTGFICSLSEESLGAIKKVYFLVTNKHVIRNANKMTLKMHKLESQFEKTNNASVKIDLGLQQETTINKDLNSLFFFHPHENIDIAVTSLNESVFSDFLPLIIPIEVDKIIPDYNNEDINIYDNIVFIGYPNGLYDQKNLLPIVRKGSFATPYQVDFNGEPVFLIDASVFPGSSGSPVFLFDRIKTKFDGKNMDLTKPKVYFLGIVASVFHKTEILDLIDVNNNNKKALGKQMIDIGIVYKSIEVRKLIKLYFINNVNEILKKNGVNTSAVEAFNNLSINKEEELDLILKEVALALK